MAYNYTEESLKSYNKQQLIKLFLEVQQQSNETISKLTNEIKLLKENYKKLESDILVSKTVSSLLTEQMNNVQRQCWANAQYSRRECLEVVGIPSSVFNRIGVAVKPDDIEACHRLFNDKKTIVKFQKGKVSQQVLRVKKELKNITLGSLIFLKAQLYLSMKVCVPTTKCYGKNVRSSGKRN